MTFTSSLFFIFFPAVFLCYYSFKENGRWLVLLLASLAFYSAFDAPYLLAALAASTLLSYSAAIVMARCRTGRGKTAVYWGGVAGNIAILAGMRYIPFIFQNINLLFDSRLTSTVLVSIGVSYFCFQAVSYLTDVYLQVEEPEAHFGHFALYMSFFPKLLQGPIERAGDLLPQLKRPAPFDYDNVRYGLMTFGWGLFKKVVVADRLAPYVNHVYDDVQGYAGLVLVVATYLYALQIYYDFSGYSDMAIGTARCFNVRLTQNFNNPYLSTSIAEFWRRWHISLSRWLQDYLFKPLQMQWRYGREWGTASAIVVTFAVSGIWHGTSWTFVLWGLLHGLYLASSVFYKPVQKRLYSRLFGSGKSRIARFWQTAVTFNLVCFAWILFRAENVNDAVHVITNLFNGSGRLQELMLAEGQSGLALLSLALACTVLTGWIVKNRGAVAFFNSRPVWVRWPCYYAFVSALLVMKTNAKSPFIYLQF